MASLSSSFPSISGMPQKVFDKIIDDLNFQELRKLRCISKGVNSKTYEAFKRSFCLRHCQVGLKQLRKLHRLSGYDIASTVHHLHLFDYHRSYAGEKAISRRLRMNPLGFDSETGTADEKALRDVRDGMADENEYRRLLLDMLRNFDQLQGIVVVNDYSKRGYTSVVDEETIPSDARATRILVDVIDGHDFGLRYVKLLNLRNVKGRSAVLDLGTQTARNAIPRPIKGAAFRHLKALTLSHAGRRRSNHYAFHLRGLLRHARKLGLRDRSAQPLPNIKRVVFWDMMPGEIAAMNGFLRLHQSTLVGVSVESWRPIPA